MNELDSVDVESDDEDDVVAAAAAEVMVESGEDVERIGMGWVGVGDEVEEEEEVEGGDVVVMVGLAFVVVLVGVGGGGMEARVVVNLDHAQFGTNLERAPLRSRAA